MTMMLPYSVSSPFGSEAICWFSSFWVERSLDTPMRMPNCLLHCGHWNTRDCPGSYWVSSNVMNWSHFGHRTRFKMKNNYGCYREWIIDEPSAPKPLWNLHGRAIGSRLGRLRFLLRNVRKSLSCLSCWWLGHQTLSLPAAWQTRWLISNKYGL